MRLYVDKKKAACNLSTSWVLCFVKTSVKLPEISPRIQTAILLPVVAAAVVAAGVVVAGVVVVAGGGGGVAVVSGGGNDGDDGANKAMSWDPAREKLQSEQSRIGLLENACETLQPLKTGRRCS